MWGPVQSISELRLERPPLIGNRRQGPDLAQVGARRSPLWLKLHLIHPSAVSHNSFMPSYAYLFQDQRGDDLVRYLQSLGSANTQQHVSAEAAWVPSSNPAGNANQLFQEYCATCHAPTGQTLLQWRSSFKRIPPNLSSGLFLPANRIAKIIKFGIAGTDMPGHEYMPDGDIAALTRMLCQCKSKELHETQPGDVQ
jgi:cytochrome c oxidase cbb3-type subunit 2